MMHRLHHGVRSVSASAFSVCALFALLLVPLPAAAQDAPAEGVTLRPDWTVGQSALYEFWTRRDQTATVRMPNNREQTGTTTYESTGETRWTVDRVRPDGTVEATMNLQWIRVAITGNDGKELVNDTRRGSGDIPPYHELLRAITDVPVSVVVRPDGTIAEIPNFSSVKARYKGEGEFPLSEADFRESATDLAVVPGPPPVADIGAAWKQTFDWSHELGTMQQQVDFRLAGVENIEGVPIATVNGEGNLRLRVDDSKFGPNAPNVTARLVDGDYITQILFDLDRDEAVGRNSVQNEAIEMTMRFPQATITRRTEQRIQSQVLRVEAGK